MRRVLLAALLALCAAPRPAAAAARTTREEDLPALVRFLMSKTNKGISVRMPVFDTDPNRGSTFGIMPIWVVMDSDTIRMIHAVAATYNSNFGVTGKYQYFYFPNPDTTLQARASFSQRVDREAVVDFDSGRLLGTKVGVGARVEASRDSSRRFFGRGPRTTQAGESNYTFDTINYRVSGTLPFNRRTPWQLKLQHQLMSNRVYDGAIDKIPDIRTIHPDEFAQTDRRQLDGTVRVGIAYDSRDSSITTTRGALIEWFAEGSYGVFFSDYKYARLGFEARKFIPWSQDPDGEPRVVTAARARFEQLDGTAPFWALPSLGGKYSHRAYEEGRWVDDGLAVAAIEQRFRVLRLNVRKIPTSIWIDPFFVSGEVFPDPARFQSRYIRPGYGFAVRAVGRPQVVGSADFGFGQEGLKVFLDINYAF